MLMKKKYTYLTLLILFALLGNSLSANTTYTKIKEINLLIDEDSYIDFIRTSIFDQPEFKYAVSLSAEQGFNLKYAKRGRFPSITGNIVNDESIERDITDNQSVRKRRDDSFDATVEIRQPLYTGGQINAAIRGANSKAKNSATQKQNTLSKLILDANQIYLSSVNGSFLFNYASNLLDILRPFKQKVKDRSC